MPFLFINRTVVCGNRFNLPTNTVSFNSNTSVLYTLVELCGIGSTPRESRFNSPLMTSTARSPFVTPSPTIKKKRNEKTTTKQFNAQRTHINTTHTMLCAATICMRLNRDENRANKQTVAVITLFRHTNIFNVVLATWTH